MVESSDPVSTPTVHTNALASGARVSSGQSAVHYISDLVTTPYSSNYLNDGHFPDR